MRTAIGAVWVCLLGLGPAAMSQAAPDPSKHSCTIDRTPPSDADKALMARRFEDAERLYGEALTADPNSGAAMAGLVRTAIAEDKLPEALAMAQKFDAAHPNDPLVMNALGEVRFRRGEVGEAAKTFNAAVKLNVCVAMTHYNVARFLDLDGMYATAQKELEQAHSLAPTNPEITRRWQSSHAVPATPEQRLAMLKARLDNPSLTDEQKEGINAAIKGIETREKGDCQLVSPVESAKLPMVPITRDGNLSSPMVAVGLDVLFNGKRRRMEIDTGASGLLLDRSVAKAAGLVPELETKAGGIGDKGATGAYVTHVDDIRIGAMEFKNCMVRVIEKGGVLDVDGLIGADVFRNYLVTLDIPGREVRLGPLPRRPDDGGPQTASLDTDEDEKPLSHADVAKDRYVAPDMKDWTPVFRYSHYLIFPTAIGNTPEKLFLMDTGAGQGMITPAAAREVTKLSSADDNYHVKGISGEVKKVMEADSVTIAFGHVRQKFDGMNSYNSTTLSRSAGVEISGLIGFPTLRELVISIDYRDNLVKVVYDPKKGIHGR